MATIAIVAAIVLLGAGLLIGAAASGHDSRARTVQPGFGPGMRVGRQGAMPGRVPNQMPGRGRQVPRYPGPGAPSASARSPGAGTECITQLTRVSSRAPG